jgi:glycosyltransferase involved in cell wall biosynthesis
MQHTKISVITPSFNQAAFIEQTLLSVQQQAYPCVEHIVVDAASNDGTIDILRSYEGKPGWRHLRWISERDGGQSDGINKGMRLASGEIFAYLCADDTYAPGALAFVDQFFREHPAVDLVYGACDFVDAQGRLIRHKKAKHFSLRRLLRNNLIWQATVFFRARAWDSVGEFNSKLQYAMDYEYWLRAASLCQIAAVDHTLACYRFHANSKSASAVPHLAEGYRVACSFGGGGLQSWYLHRVYWPGTSGLKRWLFAKANQLTHRTTTHVSSWSSYE